MNTKNTKSKTTVRRVILTALITLGLVEGGFAGEAGSRNGSANSTPTVDTATPSLFESTPTKSPVMFTGYLADLTTKIPKEWRMEERDGLAVVDGDIVLGTVDELSNPSSSKALQYTKANLWTKGVVPYVLPADFPNRATVLAAIAEIEAKTKIKFVPRTSEKPHIHFDLTDNPNVGGQSLYGMQPNGQSLWLNRDTGKWNRGVVVHELCHALCIAHEQCRADRDQNVRIAYEHILSDYESQFTQLFGAGQDRGVYDYDSIMHYPRRAFSKDGQDTIIPVNPGANIGQRNGLSVGDIKGLSETYAEEIAKR
jgi:hypothetical protein